MAAADRFFEKVLNDVLTATEQFSEKLEEGLSTIWKGIQNIDNDAHGHKNEALHDERGGYSNDNPMMDHELDDGDDYDEEWARESPLQGIADSVVGDILGKQVSVSLNQSAALHVLWKCAKGPGSNKTNYVLKKQTLHAWYETRLDHKLHGRTGKHSRVP